MDSIDPLIEEAEKNGEWTSELTDKYLLMSKQEDDVMQEDDCVIRPYKSRDRIDVNNLVLRIGNYSLREMIDDGYDINVLDNDKKVSGIIASRDDGIGTYIGAIAVDSEHEGKGYAQKLIGFIDTEDRMSAKISVGNVRSMNLFAKYGFSHGHIEDGKRWMIR